MVTSSTQVLIMPNLINQCRPAQHPFTTVQQGLHQGKFLGGEAQARPAIENFIAVWVEAEVTPSQD
jgi:hypothetical protein